MVYFLTIALAAPSGGSPDKGRQGTLLFPLCPHSCWRVQLPILWLQHPSTDSRANFLGFQLRPKSSSSPGSSSSSSISVGLLRLSVLQTEQLPGSQCLQRETALARVHLVSQSDESPFIISIHSIGSVPLQNPD